VETLLAVLTNAHRRYLLAFLREQSDGACSFDAATDHVVAEARRKRDERLDPDAVELGLCHRHLPMLADAGLVEHDARSETIRYRSDARLEALADRLRELETQ